MAPTPTPKGDPASADPAPGLAAAENDEPSAHTLKVLPAGMEPNPPSVEDLAASGMTWRGEYEASFDGTPLVGPDARPLPVLYNKKGKRVKSKIKVAKSHPISIVDGTMTVDGWTGKARLNHDIPDLKFIYLSAPTIGTVIVSQSAFPGSLEQKDAFRENTLSVKVGDHEFQLASEKPLTGKKPESAWVKFDPQYTEDSRYPVMGYGSTAGAPYEWPGAKRIENKEATVAPPLPTGMRPKLATAVCITNCGKVPGFSPAAQAVPAAEPSPAK
ncbi:hypothetical protein [Terriglobus roseus]|uniref:hypothetical protein n=1 Tax=Terriglobus roseus TaxID=392734 RepID=UPI0003094441|nr:hypothetical protein [Terriglobus roseus]